MRLRVFLATLLVAVVLAAFACGGNKRPPPKEPAITVTTTNAGLDPDAAAPAEPPAPKSLYDRLGAKEGIAKVVDVFVTKVAADPVVKKRFAAVKGPRLDKFKQNLIDYFCVAAGGPDADCQYQGKGMKEAHKGMKIKEEEWNAVVADLAAAFDECNVSKDDQADLMALLGPVKDDTVEVKPKEKPVRK